MFATEDEDDMSVTDDVAGLQQWREDVVDPAIEKVNTLWDNRNFARGALWFIGGVSTVTLALVVALFAWALDHVEIKANVIGQTQQQQASDPWITARK
jgi:hypothetical protein